jgi:hypothetical protein
MDNIPALPTQMTDSAAAPPTQTTDHDHACEDLPPIPLSASIAKLITYISLPVTIIFSIVWWYTSSSIAQIAFTTSNCIGTFCMVYGDFMTCKECRRRRALKKQKQLEDGMGARDEKTALGGGERVFRTGDEKTGLLVDVE